MEDIVKSKSECSFSRMVRSVSRLESVKIGAGIDVGEKPGKKESLQDLRDIVQVRDRAEVGRIRGRESRFFENRSNLSHLEHSGKNFL